MPKCHACTKIQLFPLVTFPMIAKEIIQNPSDDKKPIPDSRAVKLIMIHAALTGGFGVTQHLKQNINSPIFFSC